MEREKNKRECWDIKTLDMYKQYDPFQYGNMDIHDSELVSHESEMQ